MSKKKCRIGHHNYETLRGGERERCTICHDEFPCRHECRHADCCMATGRPLPDGVESPGYAPGTPVPVGAFSAALVLAIALTGCAGTFSSHVFPSDFRVAYAATSTLIACDYGQTMWTSDTGKWDRVDSAGKNLHEMNPLLGEHPSPAFLTGVVLADLGVNYAVYRSHAPDWFKWVWFSAIGSAEVYTVMGNSQWTGACGVTGQSHTTIEPTMEEAR